MHSEYDFLQDRNNELQEENKELREKLEFIEQGQPHPCTFDGKRNTSEYTFEDWLKKLKEEVAEVEVEVEKLKAKGKHHIDDITEEEDIENLTEELHDVITLATSELDYLQWSIYGRLQKQKGVNEKNRKRGYYRDEV